MAQMTILEAAEHLGVSKEAIHNRVRRGSLEVSVIDGVKYVDIDPSAKKTTASRSQTTRRSNKVSEDKYYSFLEEQNSQLQAKVEKLEGETRSLRDQKEAMLIQEREKIEQIYKEKDEQLKNFFTTLSSQFMLSAPHANHVEEHLDAEIEEVSQEETVEVTKKKKSKKGEIISLKKYLKKQEFSEKKKEKIFARFEKKARKDERILVFDKKIYLDTIKYDYEDLIR